MISVIIPAFNSEKTIARAIQSVLEQTYKDFEIIVVDDGSIDSTRNVVAEYSEKVRYIYQNNAGPAAARNTALKAAKGRWIAFLDSDDQWLAGKLEKQMRLLDANPHLKWCCTNRFQTDGIQKTEVGNSAKIQQALGQRQFFENYFDAANKGLCPIITTCLVIDKAMFDEFGVFNPAYIRGEDLDVWWKIAHRYPAVGFIAEPLAIRYLDAESPQAKKMRIELRKSDIGVKLIREHLLLADKAGMSNNFLPFASAQLKVCLSIMAFSGGARPAFAASKEFRQLLPVWWRGLIALSAICPPLTSFAAKVVYSFVILLQRSKKVIRKS
jgi:glycosyltransferase involved in cell wall biosynthesis